MATGVERRAQMDTETVKGLLLMNGGGAVALLAFIPAVLSVPAYRPLAVAAVWALFAYQCGLLFAIVYNRLRRKCSLEYELAQGSSPSVPDPCERRWISWISEGEPCVCCVGIFFMWASVGSFFLAGTIILCGGLRVL